MTVKPSIDLTPEVALDLLAKAVAKRGEDYVYEKLDYASGLECRYAHRGAPSCLVGEVLFEAGITLAALVRFDRDEIGNPSALVDTDSLDIPFATAFALDRAQQAQDTGKTWGAALQAARDYVADNRTENA